MVAEARSPPVGNPPLVARMESVRFGVVPVHPLQNKLTSTFVTCPVPMGVNVCPNHVVVLKPPPEVVISEFCGSPFTSCAEFGVVRRSTLVGTPACKSACVVSVTH